MSTVASRAIQLTRESSIFRLAFAYRADLVDQARALPYAAFDADTKTWTTPVCSQTVDLLRSLHHQGLTDVPVDSLLEPSEALSPVPAATLRAGTRSRPYAVHIGIRNDHLYSRLRAIPGSTWDKKSHALTYPAAAAAALAELIDRGIVHDPDNLLGTSGATVLFDTRTGTFRIRSNDSRAQDAFARHFPARDVVSEWQDKGLEVTFLDSFTESMYRGELARVHPHPAPAGLRMPLFDYQLRNYSVAIHRDGHAVFDEPGLGKTATGIAVGLHLLNEKAVTRVVVVVPAAVRTQWANEITRFTGDTEVAVVRGGPAQRKEAYELAQRSRWVVVHYDILARDIDDLKPVFDGALVVADEAHRCKSRDAARTKALRTLSTGAARRLALTGTPVETNPGEWFEILSGWASPGCLGSSFDFNERYRWKNRWGGYEGARNIDELRIRSAPFYTRHTKAQVAEHLPPLRVQHLALDPDPAYAAALRRAHADAADEIREAATAKASSRGGLLLDETTMDEVAAGAEMTAVGLLRMLCSSPRIIADSDSAAAAAMREAGLIPDADGPKLDELRNMAAALRDVTDRRRLTIPDAEATAQDVNGERMVIFTFSRRMADLIAERFAEDGIPHVLFTGSTSSSDRDAAVAAFTDPTKDVTAFIATDAGAEGLNLGRCCSLLVNVDLAWTAARMAQRAQRIHRIDGTAPRYLVVNLTVAGTIEAGILRLLESRADLSDALFGEEGSRSKASGRGRRGGRSLIEEAFDGYAIQGPVPAKPAPKPAADSGDTATGSPDDTGADQMALPISEA